MWQMLPQSGACVPDMCDTALSGGCLSLLTRQISIMSNDLESPRTKSVRKRRVSERRHGEPPQEKKEPRVEKLIQAETAETGQVGAF